MSLRLRIWLAFVFTIILTVLLASGIAYWSARYRVGQLVQKVNVSEAKDLSVLLTKYYSDSKDEKVLKDVLAKSKYFFDEAYIKEAYAGVLTGDKTIEDVETQYSKVRVVILNPDKLVVFDTFEELTKGEAFQEETTLIPFYDSSKQVAGWTFVDTKQAVWAKESNELLTDTIRTMVLGGWLTVLLALILAAWLAKRITAPVVALTQATKVIAEQGGNNGSEHSRFLPVRSSDELGQMSQAFNQMMTSLDSQKELRKRLINDVSHELNTPLSVIQLEANALKDGLQGAEKAAANIMAEVDLLSALVDDLSWLAESDNADLRLNLEACDVGQLLEAEVARWQNEARAQTIALSLYLSPEISTTKLDKLRIRQAFGNVIQNAIQYTVDGDAISIDASQKDEKLVISIKDDGSGISARDLSHVFERFYRADEARTYRAGGRGLGLTIAKTIVEAHEGSISISSDGLHKGTEVIIELPYKNS